MVHIKINACTVVTNVAENGKSTPPQGESLGRARLEETPRDTLERNLGLPKTSEEADKELEVRLSGLHRQYEFHERQKQEMLAYVERDYLNRDTDLNLGKSNDSPTETVRVVGIRECYDQSLPGPREGWPLRYFHFDAYRVSEPGEVARVRLRYDWEERSIVLDPE